MTVSVRADESAGRTDLAGARRSIAEAAAPLPAETCALGDALGRVIARPRYAAGDLMPYARSAMDGFALRARDTRGAELRAVKLRVSGAGYAGGAPPPLPFATASAIATGAPLPAGADAVLPVEDAAFANGAIAVGRQLEPDDHVFLPGDDAKSGDTLVRRGQVVTPGSVALLAAAGHTHVDVHRRPRVAVVCTGDELVGIHERPAAGQIRNSNAAMLAALLARDGADVVSATTVRDDPSALRDAFAHALASADLLITTGGASVGERDFVKAALAARGARFAFRSVALRPAKPAAFAQLGKALILVLPGNPAAAFIGYAALGRAAVAGLSGRQMPRFAPVRATLRGTIRTKAGRHFVLFGRLRCEDAGLAVEPLENQCSSLVRTAAEADALIVVPPGSGLRSSGATVDVEILECSSLGTARR